jgi:hypothetical protein
MVTGLLMMVFCLLGCTGTTIPSNSHGISGKPYTPPTEIIRTTPPPPTAAPSATTLPPRITLAMVNMPPDMSGRITVMLKVLPVVPGINNGLVNFIDYSAWQETLGIDLSGYLSSEGEITTLSENTYVNDLILSPFNAADTIRQGWQPWLGRPPFISGMGLWMNFLGQDKILKIPVRSVNVGYGPLDIERSVWCSTFNGKVLGTYEAIEGNFDIAAVSRAAVDYPEPQYSPVWSRSSGIDIYSWDGERISARVLHPPLFDDFGQGRTLAVQPQDIFGCIQAGSIDDMIAASQGKTTRLADSLLFQEMADKLELMGAMSAVMSDYFLVPDQHSGSTDRYTQQREELFNESALTAPLLGPYLAYAAGLGVDELGLFVALVLVYDSPDLAEKDIPIMKERLAAGYNTAKGPWAVEADSFEIWPDGITLCAKLRGNVTSYWDCFVGQEPLLVRAK